MANLWWKLRNWFSRLLYGWRRKRALAALPQPEYTTPYVPRPWVPVDRTGCAGLRYDQQGRRRKREKKNNCWLPINVRLRCQWQRVHAARKHTSHSSA